MSHRTPTAQDHPQPDADAATVSTDHYAPPMAAQHRDAGARCLVAHPCGAGQCIRCTCGAWIRPREWAEHADEGG